MKGESKMKIEFKNQWGHTYHLTLNQSKYMNNDNLAITADCHDDGYPEPYGNVTVNFGVKLEDNQAYIDTNNMAGIEIKLEELGIAKPTGRTRPSGFCTYPLYEFDLEKVKEYQR